MFVYCWSKTWNEDHEAGVYVECGIFSGGNGVASLQRWFIQTPLEDSFENRAVEMTWHDENLNLLFHNAPVISQWLLNHELRIH